MHALVVDGEVTRVGVLPTSWRLEDGRCVVGWRLASPEVHRAAGWYPVVDDRPVLGPGETWGPVTYTVGETTVTMTAEVVALPSDGPTPEDRIAALEDAVDTLILDALGGP